MFRNLLRRRVAAAWLGAHGRLGSGSYSTLVRRPVTRRHLTFCQWRYWRQAVGWENGTAQCVGQWRALGVVSGNSECPRSMADVFEQYSALLERNSFDPEHVVHFTTALRSAVYCNLRWLPWLHCDNHGISFMQILMNDKIEDLLKKPLYSQEHFDSVFSHIEQAADQLPHEDCPTILLSLLYSGVDKTEPVIHKLLFRCLDSVSAFDIHHLRELCHVLQTTKGRDFKLAERVLCRLGDLITGDAAAALSEAEVQDLCIAMPILAVMMSQDLLEKISHAMLWSLQQAAPPLDVATIGSCFRYTHKMKYRVRPDLVEQFKSVGKASLDRLDDCAHLQSYHIAEVCHNAKRLGCYSGQVVQKIQARSLQLLRENERDLHVRDVTNLMFAFSRSADPSFKEEATQLLIDHLEDSDVLTLSNIGDNILDLDLDDPDLIACFQAQVLRHIGNISQYITRLVKILRVLRERHGHNRANFHQSLCSALLSFLGGHPGYDPTLVVVTAQYLLPHVRSAIPAVLMEALLFAVPRCNLSFMLMLLSSLDKVAGSPRSRSLHIQMLELQSCMQQNIRHQIHSATHASQLASLIRGLYIKPRIKDPSLLEHIMEQLPSLTSSMAPSDFMRTLAAFRRLPAPYSHPRVFEDLIAFARDNYSQISSSTVLDLVTVLSSAGYRPENFEAFAAFADEVLGEAMQTEDYFTQISLAHHLSLLGVLPDRLLGQIFTFHYLERLDRTLEESGEKKDRRGLVRNLMMQLNRSVILECPHLDVPWFHQQYCQNLMEAYATKGFQNLLMQEEVEMALQELVTDHSCVASQVHSPYFHPIDFEVVLDASGQPVSSAAVKHRRLEGKGYHRVALMLLGNQRLCINSSQPRGVYLRDRRQLEILGYRVEEISRHDWHSMALREWEAKVDFVRGKIFPHRHGDDGKQMVGSAIPKTTSVSPRL